MSTSTLFDDGFGNDVLALGIVPVNTLGMFHKVVWFLFSVTPDQGIPVEFMPSTPGDTVTLRAAGKRVQS